MAKLEKLEAKMEQMDVEQRTYYENISGQFDAINRRGFCEESRQLRRAERGRQLPDSAEAKAERLAITTVPCCRREGRGPITDLME
eukprot:1249254-Prymnesium_polylepis.1